MEILKRTMFSKTDFEYNGAIHMSISLLLISLYVKPLDVRSEIYTLISAEGTFVGKKRNK